MDPALKTPRHTLLGGKQRTFHNGIAARCETCTLRFVSPISSTKEEYPGAKGVVLPSGWFQGATSDRKGGKRNPYFAEFIMLAWGTRRTKKGQG